MDFIKIEYEFQESAPFIKEPLRVISDIWIARSYLKGGTFLKLSFKRTWELTELDDVTFHKIAYMMSTNVSMTNLESNSFESVSVYSQDEFGVLLEDATLKNNAFMKIVNLYSMHGYVTNFIGRRVSSYNDTFQDQSGLYSDMIVEYGGPADGLELQNSVYYTQFFSKSILDYLIIKFEYLKVDNSRISKGNLLNLNHRSIFIVSQSTLKNIQLEANAVIVYFESSDGVFNDTPNLELESKLSGSNYYFQTVVSALNFIQQDYGNPQKPDLFHKPLMVSDSIFFNTSMSHSSISSFNQIRSPLSKVVLTSSTFARLFIEGIIDSVLSFSNCIEVIIDRNLFSRANGNGPYIKSKESPKFAFTENWVNMLFSFLSSNYEDFWDLTLKNIDTLKQFPDDSELTTPNETQADLTLLEIYLSKLESVVIHSNMFTRANAATSFIWVNAEKLYGNISFENNQFRSIAMAPSFHMSYRSRTNLILLDPFRASAIPDLNIAAVFQNNIFANIAVLEGQDFVGLLENDLFGLFLAEMQLKFVGNIMSKVRHRSRFSGVLKLMRKEAFYYTNNSVTDVEIATQKPLFMATTTKVRFSGNYFRSIRSAYSDSVPNGLLYVLGAYRREKNITAEDLNVELTNNVFVEVIGSYAPILASEENPISLAAINKTYIDCQSALSGAFFTLTNSIIRNMTFYKTHILPIQLSFEKIDSASESKTDTAMLASANFLQVKTPAPGLAITVSEFYINNSISECFDSDNVHSDQWIPLVGLVFIMDSANTSDARFSEIRINNVLLDRSLLVPGSSPDNPFGVLGLDAGNITIRSSSFTSVNPFRTSLIYLISDEYAAISLNIYDTVFHNITLKSNGAGQANFPFDQEEAPYLFSKYTGYFQSELEFAVIKIYGNELLAQELPLTLMIQNCQFVSIYEDIEDQKAN